MKPYSKTDLELIREKYSPSGTTCRVVEMHHLRGEKYHTDNTKFFTNFEEAMDFASEGGAWAEVDMPEYQGTSAFSADGKTVRILTQFAQ